MPDNLIFLNQITKLNVPIERVLQRAEEHLSSGVVLGYTKEDGFYFASSYADGAEVLWLLEQAKKKLLEVAE